MAWVSITEPTELDSRKLYYGVEFPEEGRVMLVGEGEDAKHEARVIVLNHADADVACYAVRVWVGVELV